MGDENESASRQKSGNNSEGGMEKEMQLLQRLVYHLEGMRVQEYVELLQRPGRLLWLNFIAGIARGLGIAIGTTIVFAFVIKLLENIIVLNIPGIGEFISQIIGVVQSKQPR